MMGQVSRMTYEDVKRIRHNPQSKDVDNKELGRLIDEAVEKQIPKVPNYSGDGYYGGELVIDTWECPCCGYQYEVDYDYHEYCPKCGQHIDHSTLTEDD